MSADSDKAILDRYVSKEAQAIDADPANDFPELTPEAIATLRHGFFKKSVVIDPDLREAFPTDKAVNDALRGLVELARKVSKAS